MRTWPECRRLRPISAGRVLALAVCRRQAGHGLSSCLRDKTQLDSRAAWQANGYTTSYTTYWLKWRATGDTVPAMEQVINSANLRRHPGECIARASKGETFVVLRYGRAIAMLRPRSTGEAYEPLRATDLWRDFPRVLARARREAVLITWYSEAVAVLGPVPRGWRRGDES